MSSQAKAITACLFFFAALIGGLYFADWLVLWMLGLKDASMAWNTWWQYFQVIDQPSYAPYALKVKASGVIGFGLPLLIWFGLLIVMFKAKAESLHGDARFATVSDAKKAGLFEQTPQSILLGKLSGRYLWLNGAQHVIVISPTRSGKTTCIAIPVLLTYQQSMVVLDLKGELRKATSGWRQSQGQTVYVWAPYADQEKTDRFNPFTLMAGLDAATRFGAIQTISAIMYPDEQGKDPFWTSQSRAAFTAFAGFMFEGWDLLWKAGLPSDPNSVETFPSFERILRLSSGRNGQTTLQMLRGILADPKGHAFVSQRTLTTFNNLAGLAEQTFSSILATMQAPLQQFLSPILANATNATDFDITRFRKRLTTLYIDIPTNKLDESAKLLNVFFSSLIGNNLTEQLGDTPELKYQMLMVMDEFTAMGRVDAWAKRIAISASYGVRSLVIVQSRAQLRSAYGDNDAQNIITNHGAQVAFAPREQSDANEYSEALGTKTIRKRHQSRSSGRGSGGTQISTNYTEEKRALFLPQEIKELPANDEIIFYEGCKPIRAKKNWFFKIAMFKKRAAMAPVEVKAKTRADADDRTKVQFKATEQGRRTLEQGL